MFTEIDGFLRWCYTSLSWLYITKTLGRHKNYCYEQKYLKCTWTVPRNVQICHLHTHSSNWISKSNILNL